MRIAVIGGAGVLGQHVVHALKQRGHDVRSLGRRSQNFPVDLVTGEGLPKALGGGQVVINASNDSSKGAGRTLVEGTRKLISAAQDAGIEHHICISMIGCDLLPIDYGRVKAAQEAATREGALPWSIVRAAQFHELVVKSLEGLSAWRIMPLPSVPMQPIAACEVADAIAVLAGQTARREMTTVAGPEVLDLRELARQWASHGGRRTLRLPVSLPGELGRRLRAGALTFAQPDVRGAIQFVDFLRART